MNRREFLGMLVQAATGLATVRRSGAAQEKEGRSEPPALPEPTPEKLPRWRGFNLLEMFQAGGATPFRPRDFAEIAELGFDFVRLPLDYRCWTDPGDWTVLREDRLRWIDEAVAFGRKYGIHVQVNFHRAPGYTVASPPEPKSLWTDPEARDVCALHWERFARRYQGVPNHALSFNLFNEPANVAPEPHKEVVQRMVQAIRAHDRDRLIVCDGRDWGTKPPTELLGLGVAAATRGYAPFHLTHYRASWVKGSDNWPKPSYPLHEDTTTWDRSNLQKDQVEPWTALQKQGIGVMVGEFGAHNRTAHDAVLAWMRDCLDTWKTAGWGWALWNYRGSFGILDSGRSDVTYESWNGHQLDREMLKLLQAA
jgi:endoglucanase